MADKEERILITKCSGWCHALRVSCDPFYDDDGMYCDKSGKWVRITDKDCAKCKAPVLYGISRQEAIDRMAKALKKVIYILSEEACLEGCEAALNALLDANNA